MAEVLTAVDLFCGAGGLSLGLASANIRCVMAVDNNLSAVRTYRRNLGPHAVCAMIDRQFSLPPASLIAGGPPCQGFSSAGQRNSDDHRNTLVGLFAELVATNRPEAFLFENVEGFLTAGGGRFVFDLLEPVIEAGYRVHLRKLNAANFGVPQHRKRVIAIGGLGWDPTFPEPSHSAHGAPGAHLTGQHLPPTPTVSEGLDGLPGAVVGRNGTLHDHTFRLLEGQDLERVRALGEGQRMRDLPEELWHPTYRRRAFRRVKDGTPTERRGGAPAGMRRLRSDEPSKAITSGARTEFLHPSEDRYLTLRECARLQTFPDSFEFLGTQAARALLIGNAVPPRLAGRIAACLADDLSSPPGSREEGALLSFVPTVSSGLSPALASVRDRVFARFGSLQRKEVLQWF